MPANASVPAPLGLHALVGQESMKLALLLAAVNPAIGGVLIRGQRGTAKSTAVRALARLLPDVEVVEGCRFGCSPGSAAELCADCRARLSDGAALPVAWRPMRVVELPINASEDRVVGSIDLREAVAQGRRRFDPGILAEANGNILYVDEVNLLDDHLVDVLLDAAAMGRNTVEREGISMAHPSRFILVGTMNPEEGELRPQLLDRFGLCVDVAGLRSLDDRVSVLETVAAAQASAPGRSPAEASLRRALAEARRLLPEVRMGAPARRLVAMACIEAGASGHRADLVTTGTARALRAWRAALSEVEVGSLGEVEVGGEDIRVAAELALAHRRRRPATEPGGGRPDAVGEAANRLEPGEAVGQPSPGETGQVPTARASGEPPGESGDGGRGSDAAGPPVAEPRAGAAPAIPEGSLFAVRSIQLPRSRRPRRQSGKRSQAPSSDRRGRYVGSRPTDRPRDVAIDATLRSAAPHQLQRRAAAERAGQPGELAVRVEPEDLRDKVRRRRTGTFIVFVVDASASMDAEQRMRATKGAVLSLLRDAYVRRDKVALVVFSGRSARVALQPTSSVDLAEQSLRRLSIGGTTPLTHGLMAGLRLVRSERLRDPAVHSLLVLISDGRGNISLFGEEPLVEAQALAQRLGEEGVRVLVIDSARDHSRPRPLPRIAGRPPEPLPSRPPAAGSHVFNPCQDLAERAGGEYLGLFDLSQGAILEGVNRSLVGR